MLVDNSTFCFLPQIENGVPIIPFYYRKDDIELLKLGSFLEKLNMDDDVREAIRNHFKFDSYADAVNIDQLCLRLFGQLFSI